MMNNNGTSLKAMGDALKELKIIEQWMTHWFANTLRMARSPLPTMTSNAICRRDASRVVLMNIVCVCFIYSVIVK